MNINPLTLIDFYKTDHRRMYPNGTSFVFSNFTNRSSRLDGVNAVVFFGLQYFIKEYLVKQWNEQFFDKPVEEVVAKYKRRLDNALGKDVVSMEHIRELHALGHLPIHIRALPEGSLVPIGVPPFIIYNTKPEGFWLVNYLETILSCSIWQASTSATIAREFKKEFVNAAKSTGGSVDFTQFQGHDFSFRGMSSLETACLSGAGHLLSFSGTDTVPAIDFLEEYYDANSDKELIGVSVAATEHSVASLSIAEEISKLDNSIEQSQKLFLGEVETLRRLLKLYPTGILSYVSDTYDFFRVLTEVLPLLKNEILARNGKLVIRPDSSPKTPFEIICGDFEAPEGTPEYKGAIELLWELFGGKINEKGFKELDPHIGLIYGDSISLKLARQINNGLMAAGFASTNWVAGIGSYTYQYNTRDTFGSAMKATYGVVNGEARAIFKDPKTDKGLKKSAKGLIAVFQDKDGFYKVEQVNWDQVENCAFQTVFMDGLEYNTQTLDQIRKLLKEFS